MILSIDVGITNLSYCLCHNTNPIKIEKWKVLDLFPADYKRCTCMCKSGKLCGKKAKYKQLDQYLCGTHLPKDISSASKDLYKVASGKRIAKKSLETLIKKYDCNKKEDLLCANVVFELARLNVRSKKPKTMVQTCIAILNIFDRELTLDSLQTILIENQLGMSAVNMKSVQSIITMYFVMRGITNIIYISPKNKLRNFDVPKSSYKERKTSAIHTTRAHLKEGINCDRLAYYESHPKKDDLADSYLQALWYLESY